ncbi:MAG: hypothetical protein CMJ64_20665 [Planctomycetaceae bacterium]|nr:hypothetical protein [Planctomycetaceae bacterium]
MLRNVATALWLIAISLAAQVGVAAIADAQRLLEQVDAGRGICVVIADSEPEVAIDLATKSDFIIYVCSKNERYLKSLQKEAYEAGLLGIRLYVQPLASDGIHLASNLADAAIVVGDGSEKLLAELSRVTHPGAKIVSGGEVSTNPTRDGSDDWSHPYHGPDNNPQSTDTAIEGPYLTQFLCDPWYVPMPQVTVSSGGRLFKAFGHIALKEREWPWLNKLVAVNAYNGTMLWKRDLTPGFMIHRNTLIATPDVLYFGDNESCKLIDATTGEVRDEIRIAKEIDPNGVWKWMAMESEVLYALLGPKEPIDKVIRGDRKVPGWPWKDLGDGYASEYAWGFGRTLIAMDPATKKVLWTYRSDEPIDSRALCVSTGRIFVYSHGKYLACVEASSGKELWKTDDEKLLAAIGQHDRAQTASKGFASSAYAKANEKGVYFAGPQRTNLVGVSALSGSLMWKYSHGNFQLVLRDDALYAMGRMETSKKFEYLTGKVLVDLDCYRGNCTRATATTNSIFTRGYRHTGTMRLDVAGNDPRRIALMRPACQDGVIIANGQLYWGPWMCDCNHSLIGMISLAPSGDFDAKRPPSNADRLDSLAERARVGLSSDDFDWPGYRGGGARAAVSQRIIADEVEVLWRREFASKAEPTAPITAGGLIFWSGHDGVVKAAHANSGKTAWTAFTGGAVRFSPEFESGRLFVGSGDGRVHCLEAGSGRALWRFRAAPADRKILVHGKLLSNWPVGSGVLVAGGTVYAAAGITSYDGTHVYSLDATTGQVNWRNNTSSELAGETRATGVSVQGHLLLHKKKLYLAGGNVVSPAVYDLDDGRCLNTIKSEWIDSFGESDQRFPKNGNSKMFHRSPRGRELFVVDGEVRVFDQLLYSPPKYGPSRYFGGHFLQAGSDKVIIRGTTNRVVRLSHLKTDKGEPIGKWQTEMFRDPTALAVCKNAVIVTGKLAARSEEASSPKYAITALRLNNGEPLWSKPLPSAPVSWGLAIDRAGRSIVTLTDGSVVCVGPSAG